MTSPSVSVVIVSRGRPKALQRCLTGIEQLFFEEFEVVVVSDPAGVDAVRNMGLGEAVKCEVFNEANISKARNVGAQIASGDILAFIDDDAVPEPSWLDTLIAPFQSSDTDVTGGYVLGRDGIRFQYRANWVDKHGWSHPLSLPDDRAKVFAADPDRATKTEGTNFAIRRSALVALGGFDDAFAYFLDETDLNLRAAYAGLNTAIVPNALVHHGFMESEQRTEASLPKTLFDIGASAAVFLRKHAPNSNFDGEIFRFRNHQRELLKRHEKRGNCTADQSEEVMATFDSGVAEGKTRKFGAHAELTGPKAAFQTFKGRQIFHGSTCFGGRAWTRRALRKRAKSNVKSGQRITIFVFEPTIRRHHMRFDYDGYWEQYGGLFGPSEPSDIRLKLFTFRARLKREMRRLSKFRRFSPRN